MPWELTFDEPLQEFKYLQKYCSLGVELDFPFHCEFLLRKLEGMGLTTGCFSTYAIPSEEGNDYVFVFPDELEAKGINLADIMAIRSEPRVYHGMSDVWDDGWKEIEEWFTMGVGSVRRYNLFRVEDWRDWSCLYTSNGYGYHPYDASEGRASLLLTPGSYPVVTPIDRLERIRKQNEREARAEEVNKEILETVAFGQKIFDRMEREDKELKAAMKWRKDNYTKARTAS